MQDGGVSPVRKFFRNKWVIGCLVFDAILVIVAIIVLVINANKQSLITLNVVPGDAKISLNGKDGYGNGSYYVAPGVYEVRIEHPGLDTKVFTIDLERHDNFSVNTFLHKGDDFEYYTLRKNIDDYSALSQMASAGYNQTTDNDTSAEGFIAEFQRAYDLYSRELPIRYRESEGFGRSLKIIRNITIRESQDCEITLCIEVSIVGGSSEEFIGQLMKEKGLNPEDYEIIYKNY